MYHLPLSLVVASFLAPVLADGTSRWTPGSPMSIPGTGSALISARARPDAGFTFVSSTVTHFENGCAVTVRNIPVGKNGIMGPAIISGLLPGKRYEVIIEVVQNRGDKNEVIVNHSYVVAR